MAVDSTRMAVARLLIAGFALALGACTSTAAPPPSDAAGRPYSIGPPDQLVITILPEPEI